MPTPANSINETTTGITGFTGTAFVGTPVTNHAVQVGGATSSTLTQLSVGASNSVLQGSTGADPAFTTTPQLVALGIGAAAGASGLTFDGTNLLANYAVASWTPNLQINNSSTGITYTTQLGGYTRIGNIVVIWGQILLSSKGASVGVVTISNLPVSTGGSANNQCMSISFYNGYTSAGYSTLGLWLSNNSSGASIVTSGSGVTVVVVTNTMISNTFQIIFSGCYTTA